MKWKKYKCRRLSKKYADFTKKKKLDPIIIDENYILAEYKEYINYCNSYIRPKPLAIEKVIFNDPVTVILWNDKTKTVVRCGEYETYDSEKGMAMAISKKFLGNKGNYYETFKKYLPEEDKGIDESNINATFKSFKEIMRNF